MTIDEAGCGLRDRILGAAFGVFVELGYAGATTSEIARRARVSKRDIYALFGSKQGMLVAGITERVNRMRIALELPVPRDREALAAILLAFGKTTVQEVSRPEVLAVYRLAILEAERAPEVARTLDELGRGGHRAALARLLVRAQAGGLLGPGDPEAMTDVFFALLWQGGLMVRLLLRVAAAPDDAEATARAQAATEALMDCGGQGHI